MKLRDIILERINHPQEPRLRISQAGKQCVREVYYAATGAERLPDTSEALVKMAIGSAVDSYALSGPHKNWKFQVPVSITEGGLTLNGTADAVFYSDGKALHVADLKVVGSWRYESGWPKPKPGTWQKIQDAPRQEHAAQTNLYAFGLGASSWSVCYVNRFTGEILEHRRDTDPDAANKDFGLFEDAKFFILKGEAPPRPYEDIEQEDGTVKIAAESFPCAWCPYKATCWRKEDDDESVQKGATV